MKKKWPESNMKKGILEDMDVVKGNIWDYDY
jgi:hypothetical protein